MVEAEILLDVAHDFRQHLLGVFAGNRGLGNTVEEGELAGPPLLLREQPGIFHRHGNLSGSGLHYFQVALLEPIFALGVQGRHDSGRPATQQNRSSTETLGRARRQKSDPQALPRPLQFGADDQRLAAADDVFRQAIGHLARAFGKNFAPLHFQFEADLVAILEGDVEIGGVKDLPQFLLHGAQNLVLVQPRADGLSNLGEQRELLGTPLRVVHDDVVFQRFFGFRHALGKVEDAEQQYQRSSGLYAAGVVSKQDLDQAKSALDYAKAQVQALDAGVREQQVQLHYYSVAAPWAGIVGDIPVHVGDRVTTSTVLTTVDKPGTLEVYVYVPIERAPQLKMNMPVEVLDASGNVLADSRVSFISPQVDSSTQTILVKARIANHKDKLRQAQFIRARVVWGSQKSPVVPVLAVSRVGGQYFAFVAEQGDKGFVARQKPLKVGQMVGNNYVVLDGVKPGDKVIVSGTQFLVDGAPVTPQGS